MPNYVKYNNETGEILSILNCPASMAAIQELESNENIMECDPDINDIDYEVVGGQVILKNETVRIQEEYNRRKNTIPPEISKDLNDSQIDAILDEYLLGQESIEDFKLRNYAQFRKKFYPELTEFNDAYVKQNSGQGNQQMDDYIEACNDVKIRFPKE